METLRVAQVAVRAVAATLIIPVSFLIFFPALGVWYTPEHRDIALHAFLFRIFVIGLAVVVFAGLPAKFRFFPGFFAFPFAALFNPFDLALYGVWYWTGEIRDGLFQAFAVLFAFESAAFLMLFGAVRVAVGKLWPARPRANA